MKKYLNEIIYVFRSWYLIKLMIIALLLNCIAYTAFGLILDRPLVGFIIGAVMGIFFNLCMILARTFNQIEKSKQNG